MNAEPSFQIGVLPQIVICKPRHKPVLAGRVNERHIAALEARAGESAAIHALRMHGNPVQHDQLRRARFVVLNAAPAALKDGPPERSLSSALQASTPVRTRSTSV